MTNVIQTCAPLKNSLALLTNEYHHLVGGSFWSSWPFLLFSEGTLWKFNSRGREDSLGLPSSSWMQSLQAVLSSLWRRAWRTEPPCAWMRLFSLDPWPPTVILMRPCGYGAGARCPAVGTNEIGWALITSFTFLTHPFPHALFLNLLGKSLLHPTTRGQFLPVVPTLLQTFAILNLLLS